MCVIMCHSVFENQSMFSGMVAKIELSQLKHSLQHIPQIVYLLFNT